MNDDELLSTVRDQRTRIAMTAPVEQIIRRGRVVRVRRRASGLAMLAAATVAAIALLPSSHPSGQGIQLAAWTVVSTPMARSMSPSANCKTRPACNANCAPTAYRPASSSATSLTSSRTRASHTVTRGSCRTWSRLRRRRDSLKATRLSW
jgi:hypothetical protein